MIDLIAADVTSWCELISGPFHDERCRFSRPEKYNQELLDACGRPLLMVGPGESKPGVLAEFHIYPPRSGRFETIEMIAERLERMLLGRTIKKEEAEALERLALTAKACVPPEDGK